MRVRLRFTKLGKVRFTSHRDVTRIWERALRRAGLAVAVTEGFRPRPKLSFGLALSTGHESLAEYLDVELATPLDAAGVAGLPARLSSELTVGVDVVAAAAVEPGGASLQEAVRSCRWRIEALGVDPNSAERLVEVALGADELVVTRQRKGRDVTDDLRPAVLSVAVVGPTAGGTDLEAELAVHPRSVRPFELLAAVTPQASEGRVLRTAQLIWREAGREEPLVAAVDPDAWRASHAQPCTTGRDPRDEPSCTRGVEAEPGHDRDRTQHFPVPAGGPPER
ncbi:MAG: TIGR03936 family radical SAM-associated protein [Actinomycetota bacterium]|nr:TIGR03936 family radical SAM-associated protein [Actinomycetota bacterium]